MFGTKCPSITSKCNQSQSRSTKAMSSANRAKSAASNDGANMIDFRFMSNGAPPIVQSHLINRRNDDTVADEYHRRPRRRARHSRALDDEDSREIGIFSLAGEFPANSDLAPPRECRARPTC